MLSHKAEKYLKTGRVEQLEEIKKIVAEADVNDLKKINTTLQSVINNATKEVDNRVKNFALIGLASGMFVGHLIFLLDPCAPEEVKNNRAQFQKEEPFIYFLADAAMTTIGSLGGAILGFLTQCGNQLNNMSRIEQLKEVIQSRPTSLACEQKDPSLRLG